MTTKTSHLYINTPFCPHLCTFCNFYKQPAEFLDKHFHPDTFGSLLVEELKLRQDQLHSRLESVYVGGGSPGELPPQTLEPLLEYLSRQYDLSGAEKTIELNPSPFLSNSSKGLVSFFNRHSMGLQSFSPPALKTLGRPYLPLIHDIEQWRAFSDNFSVDMIYDIPDSPLDRLKQDLRALDRIQPDHLSWYSLELDNLGIASQLPCYQEEQGGPGATNVVEFELIKETLEGKGYWQYEISNFARGHKRSRHNLAYWNRSPYLGLGPGAVGAFYGQGGKEGGPDNVSYRYTNHTSLSHYRAKIKKGQLPEQVRETLSPSQSINECVMLSLRQTKGLDVNLLQKTFGFNFLAAHQKTIDKYRDYLEVAAGHLRLNKRGFMFFNTICADFFEVVR